MATLLLTLLAVILLIVFMPGFTPRIKRTGSQPSGRTIAELRTVTLGNAEQWVLIRSENTDNPVLLFVHGGPGTSQMTRSRRETRALERHFIVVNWDQRGAGKSFAAVRDTGRMTMEQCLADLHELSEYLIKRFGKEKILLAGHSWGSALGMIAVSRRPELYSGYIGIGQVAAMAEGEALSYEWTLQQAQAANDANAVQTLLKVGHPPYTGTWQSKFMTQRRLLGKFGGEYYGSTSGAFGVVLKNLLLSTEYTFMDRINFFRGIFKSVELLFPRLLEVNLFTQVPSVAVPVWFVLGRHDYEVPSVLAAKYFDALSAPMKTLFWFEQSAHLPNTEERDLFNKLLVEQVLPVILHIRKS